MGVQITPGQRCLLEILQRKLIATIKEYHDVYKWRDSSKKKANPRSLDKRHEREIIRLREKIKRISGRQKRFVSEIVNGNGNNTIPKESFLKALGLVTRETLQQINSKSNERRRRTTANPRFSHEAIQAKQALQKPRIQEPRATRERRNASSNTAAATATATAPESTTRNNNKQSGGRQSSSRSNRKGASQATTPAAGERNARSNSEKVANNEISAISHENHNQEAGPEEQLTERDKSELYDEFKQLGIYFQLRAEEFRKKFKNKEDIEDDMRWRAMGLKRFSEKTGLSVELAEELYGTYQVSSAGHMLYDAQERKEADEKRKEKRQCDSSPSSATSHASSRSSSPSSGWSSTPTTSSPQPPVQTAQASLATKNGENYCNLAPATTDDNWMRCDESLDGLS